MSSDDFSIIFSCSLPNNSLPKISSKFFDKEINDLNVLTIDVYGLNEIKSQYKNKLERSLFLTNFTFDYQKTLDCITPRNIFAINSIDKVEKKISSSRKEKIKSVGNSKKKSEHFAILSWSHWKDKNP